jgi:hypothetical protein
VSAPGVVLGVSRPEPLRELSLLLGVWVTDVEHVRVFIGGRPQPDNNAWLVTVAGRDPDHWPVKTRELRAPHSLNWWVLRWGRDLRLPPLTSGDGRRALRLMHEHVESKTEHHNTHTDREN